MKYPLPLEFIVDKELTRTDILVYTVLSSYVDKEGECFPSISTIAGILKCSTRSVEQSLKHFRDLGRHIEITKKKSGRSKYIRNHYKLTSDFWKVKSKSTKLEYREIKGKDNTTGLKEKFDW